MALINVMARAGLRVSEALALKVGDIELGPRSGTLLVRTGKGLKEPFLKYLHQQCAWARVPL
jgi:site-specific recombinase XerD